MKEARNYQEFFGAVDCYPKTGVRGRHARRVEGLDLSVCYVTTKGMMQRCGVQHTAIRDWVARRLLKPVRPPTKGRSMLFHPDEVKRFMETRKC